MGNFRKQGLVTFWFAAFSLLTTTLLVQPAQASSGGTLVINAPSNTNITITNTTGTGVVGTNTTGTGVVGTSNTNITITNTTGTGVVGTSLGIAPVVNATSAFNIQVGTINPAIFYLHVPSYPNTNFDLKRSINIFHAMPEGIIKFSDQHSADMDGEIFLNVPAMNDAGANRSAEEIELGNTLEPNLRIRIKMPASASSASGEILANVSRRGLLKTVMHENRTVSASQVILQDGKIRFNIAP